MTREETKKILMVIQASFPNWKPQSDLGFLIDTWALMFEGYSYHMVSMGLKAYITTEAKGFAPSIGQLVDCIHKIGDYQDDSLTEMSAWGMVYKAVCNSNYNSEAEYNNLPEPVREAVGNPAMLREWAALPTDEVQTVIQSNFMRSFRAAQAWQKELRRMPEEVRKLIGKTVGLLEKPETDGDTDGCT